MAAVSEMFELPGGDVELPENGRWWITRDHLGVDPVARSVVVRISDGHQVTCITASPEMLRALGHALIAQADSALANTEA